MRSRSIPLAGFTFFCLLGVRVRGDAYDPPTNYYSTAAGTGTTLKQQLNNIVDGHTDIGYDAARTALQVTDADPNRPGYMITVYDRTSLNVAAINPGGPVPGWDNAATWNREHTWPRSRGVEDSGPDDSDLFALRPALTAGNGARANYNFGGAYAQQPMGLVTAPEPDMWYPGNADAGMIARQAFYMAVRYDGVDNASNTTNLELAPGNPGASQTTALMGDKDRLIEWHFAAPPDDFERRRNQIIYDQYQDNRNPFTDRPEWAWSVFVDQANDSQIALGSTVPASDGSSALLIDMGAVIANGKYPGHQSVTLNKAGSDGTYFQVTTSGQAISGINGRYNAFRTTMTDARSMTVGLNSNTSTVGLKSGTVMIDNLDITTGAGAGRGGQDGDDVVTLELRVLDHANPSFAGGSDLNTLTYDFGTVLLGSVAPTFNFNIDNLATAASFTAALDLDSIQGAGHVGELTTNLATFGGSAALDEGASRAFVATMGTSATGAFAASYTLNFSDENLVGATTLGALTLNLTGRVASADFDQNGVVDGADMLVWQRGFGAGSGATLADGDADGSGAVDAADFTAWQNRFGAAPAAVNAPEPCAFLAALCSLSVLVTCRRRRTLIA
jgi:endonuclease I